MSSKTAARAIGPYVPLRKIGEGGMGVVYCARDNRHPDRLVALKVISASSIGAGDDSGRRFLRESRLLERLRHPNIVSLYEVGLHAGTPYFAMEFLSGTPLTAFAGRPWPETLPLLIQICDGMEYLAAASIVHRDLSLDNVFIVREGTELRAKILDFGIAKDVVAEETLHNFTKTGLLLGKPPYWSPEQIGSLPAGQKIDWRSDLYTLGVMFHRVLAGSLPFLADSPIGYIPLHLEAQAPALEAPRGNPPIPAPVATIVRQMLAKDREERPSSYGEIVSVLEGALRAAGTLEVLRPGLNPLPGADDSPWATRTKQPGAMGPAVEAVPPTRPVDRPVTAATAGYEEEPTRTLTMTARTRPGRTKRTVVEPRPVRKFWPRAVGVLATLAAVAALVGVGLRITRPSPGPAGSATEAARGPSRMAGGPPAVLALDAFPWGRVMSIVDADSRRSLPIEAGATTPLRVTLPPGRYAISVRSGSGPDTRVFTVSLGPGESRAETISFARAADVVPLLEQTGEP